jgi:replicative DNA helicase
MELYDHDAEREVIGVISQASVLDVQAANILVEQVQLTPLDFHFPSHAKVFQTALALLERGLPVTPLSIKNTLQSPEALEAAGGWGELTKLTMGEFHVETHLAGYAKQLKELSVRRAVLAQLKKAAESIHEKEVDPNVLLARLAGDFAQMSKFTGSIMDLTQVMDEVSEHLDKMRAGEISPVIQSGIAVLDKTIGGWQPTLTLMGAEPGVGKSALFAATSNSLAKRGIVSCVFTLEDEASWLAWRLLSNEAGLDQHIIRFTQMNESQVQRTGQGFRRLYQPAKNILVVDGSERGMRIEDIVSASKDAITKRGAKVIMVDHLGEITSGAQGEARYDLEVSRHLSLLRGIANRYGVPVIVASHFKRGDGDPMAPPKLSDFANSSGAERKARVAIGLRRAPGSDVIRMYVIKNTNGKSGFCVEAAFHGAAAMIETVEGPMEAA